MEAKGAHYADLKFCVLFEDPETRMAVVRGLHKLETLTLITVPGPVPGQSSAG